MMKKILFLTLVVLSLVSAQYTKYYSPLSFNLKGCSYEINR